MHDAVLIKLIENGAAAAVPALLMAVLIGVPAFQLARRLVDATIESMHEMVQHTAKLASAQEKCSDRHAQSMATYSAQAAQAAQSILAAISAGFSACDDDHDEILAELRRGHDGTRTTRPQHVDDRTAMAAAPAQDPGGTQ